MTEPTRRNLIDRVLNDEATPDELARFESLVLTDDDFAREVARHAAALIDLTHCPIAASAPLPIYRKGCEPKPSRFRPHHYAIAAALLAACGLAIYLIAFSADPSDIEHRPSNIEHPPLATLIESTPGSNLTTPGGFISEGRDYPRGEYALDKGTAEFMLTNSVNVKLRGSTRIFMRNNMDVALARGSAAFVVPHDAKGFIVHLPDESKIVDLGTAFKVEVDDDGETQLRVTEGAVEWTAAGQDAEPVHLVAGQTARLVDGRPVITGTLIASFNFGGRANPITGVSGPTGPFNTEGSDILGPDADAAWTNLVSNESSVVASDGGVTFRFALNDEVYQHEAPGGFEPGDLRAYAWRLLGPTHAITDNDVAWELTGLTPGASYDLVFYGGDRARPHLQRIDNTFGASETDTEGDVNITAAIADAEGKITGAWLQPDGFAITNWSGLQIQTHVAPIESVASEPIHPQSRQRVGETSETE